MIEDPCQSLGVALWFLITLLYVFIEVRKRKQRPSLANVIIILLASVGICVGGKLCIQALQEGDLVISSKEKVYIFIGGFAVVWVSIESVSLPFLGRRRK